jgi:hypothetical protein
MSQVRLFFLPDWFADRQLTEGKAEVAIIGRTQNTTDIPAHQHLKGSVTADGAWLVFWGEERGTLCVTFVSGIFFSVFATDAEWL